MILISVHIYIFYSDTFYKGIWLFSYPNFRYENKNLKQFHTVDSCQSLQ